MPGKVREFDEDWRVAILPHFISRDLNNRLHKCQCRCQPVGIGGPAERSDAVSVSDSPGGAATNNVSGRPVQKVVCEAVGVRSRPGTHCTEERGGWLDLLVALSIPFFGHFCLNGMPNWR